MPGDGDFHRCADAEDDRTDGVITFPGTLDDVDAARAVRYAGAESVSLWHARRGPGRRRRRRRPCGFSYGDYLRAGAIAAQARSCVR